MSKEKTLNKQQEIAAYYQGNAQNLLVVAGAGCGKTKTIISRAAFLIKSGTSASRILMLTFTNRAAREMKKRLKNEIGPVAEKVNAGTFHSFCLKVMSKVPKSFEVEGLNIIDVDDQNSLMSLVRSRFVNKKDKNINKEFPRVSELVKYYSYSRNTCQNPKTYLDENTEMNDQYIQMCCNIFSDYQKAKERRGYLDFDDLLERLGNILSRKPKLRKAVAKLFDEVLVDEMQDTNPLQFIILRHFSDEGVRLFCVGDPAQSIYRFRGAEFEHVYRFGELFERSLTLPLSINYRSYQEVLDLANWLISKSPLDYANRLIADRGDCGNLPMLVDFDSTQEEASWIADQILERWENDIPYRDIMVLVRTGFDGKHIEAEFIQREIPYRFIGGTALTKTAHVRDVLSLLRVVRNAEDDLAWMRYLKLWPRIGEKTAEKVISAFYEHTSNGVKDILGKKLGNSHGVVGAYKETLENYSVTKRCVLSAIHNLTPILKERYDRWNYRSRDLELLSSVAERYKSVSDFIDAFTLEPMTSTEINQLEVDDAVTLITVHSAKGTEAPICFVANAKPGTYPHFRSYGDITSEEEERRILYVALTRAKNELFITRSSDYRSSFYVANKPTEGEEYFLSEVPDELVRNEIIGWSADNNELSRLKDIF